jgi:hypothetical protein
MASAWTHAHAETDKPAASKALIRQEKDAIQIEK